jgi:streptogramin lyase
MRVDRVDREPAVSSGKKDGLNGSSRLRRPQRKPVLEPLEGRVLLAALTEYPVSSGAMPAGIASGIVAVPGGNLWFTEPGIDKIGEITTTGHLVGEFPISSAANSITFGPDGNLWFTEPAANMIGVITTGGTVVAGYPVPTAASNPLGITVGSDGNLWFTEAATGKLGRIIPPSGIVSDFGLKTPGGQPAGITSGPDGNLWFTLPGTNQIGTFSLSTYVDSEFGITTPGSLPQGISSGPDGNLWFTEAGAGKIGVINTSGVVIAQIAVPTPAGVTEGIASGSDGNLWFTEPGTSQVGRVTTSGVVTEFAVPTQPSQPWGVTTGPDGNIWFTEAGANNVAKVALSQLITATGNAVETQVGTATSLTIASFKAAALNPAPGDFTATIDWGDGSAPAAGTITASAGGTFLVSATKTYTAPGTYQAQVTIRDQGGASATATSTVTVAFAAAGNSISPVEGQLFTGQVASFSDPQTTGNVGAYSATINWGDSSTSMGTITYLGGTNFSVAGSHTYAEEGTYGVTVFVTGPNGRNFLAYGQSVTADAPLHAVGTTPQATAGVPVTTVVATFSDDDPSGTATDYHAMIVWGDGHTSPGTIVPSSPPTSIFSVQGSNTYATTGTFIAQVTIIDAGGASAMASSTVTVGNVSGNVVDAVEGQLFTAEVASFSDTQTTGQVGQYSAIIAWGDSTTSTGTITYLGGTSFTVTGTHTYSEEGPYGVAVTINAPGGRMFFANGQANVADASLNAVPTTAMAAATVPFTGVVATFSDDDPMGTASDYVATIIWGDGHTSAGTIVPPSAPNSFFSVTGSNTYATTGSYSVQVTITDVGGAQASTTSTVTVASPATGDTIRPVEGRLFSGEVATFSDAQTNGNVGAYSATIYWGDSSTTSGTITFLGGTNFSVAGTHTYAEEGTYPVTVLVAGPDGRSFLAYGQAVTTDAPLHAVGTTAQATAGVPVTTVVATFSDEDPAGTSTDYQAMIVWGDGHTSPGTIVPPSAPNGFFSVVGSNTYATTGTFVAQVTITDVGGASATTSSTVTVGNVSGNVVNAVEGLLFPPVEVASFSDAQTTGQVGQYSATIAWGDSTTSTGTITYLGGTSFIVTGTHAYNEEGTYGVAVTINGPNGRTFLASSQALVIDAPLLASPVAFAPTAGVPFTGVVATFIDEDPNGTPSDYRATIQWGDGHISNSVMILASGGYFTVTGSNTYAAPGTYSFTVTISDTAGGSQAIASGTVNVAGSSAVATGATIAPTEGQPFAGTVATFTTSDSTQTAGEFQASIAWGDGQVSSGSISQSSTGFTVSGVHTYLDEGTLPLIVTITGPGNLKVIAAGQANVGDAALTIFPNTIRPEAGVAFGGLIVATFRDANPLATAADYLAVITWGDGGFSDGLVASDGNGGFVVTGSHTYTVLGKTYPITVQVFDLGGSMASTSASQALVGGPVLPLTGFLTPESISGPDKNLNITNVNRPTFQGTASAFAIVQLFAQKATTNPTTSIYLGQTIAGPDGLWSLTAARLPDGVYTVSASMTPEAGFPSAPITIVFQDNPLVIDTVAPRVSGFVFNPHTGMITVVIQDYGAGLDETSLLDTFNYTIMPRRTLVGRNTGSVSLAPAISGFYSGAESATLQFHAPVGPGRYLFQVKSGGIIDRAGNPLDGEFTGKLPSGNGRPGGNFIVQIHVPAHRARSRHRAHR